MKNWNLLKIAVAGFTAWMAVSAVHHGGTAGLYLWVMLGAFWFGLWTGWMLQKETGA